MNFGGKRRKTHYYLRVSSELTFSLRNLRRSPGFALTAICTFALAIGTSTAVFSVVNRVLLEPPPISDPDRVMVMWARERGAGTIGEISHSTFRAWQEKTRSFESLAAMGSVNWRRRAVVPVVPQLAYAAISISSRCVTIHPMGKTCPLALGTVLYTNCGERHDHGVEAEHSTVCDNTGL